MYNLGGPWQLRATFPTRLGARSGGERAGQAAPAELQSLLTEAWRDLEIKGRLHRGEVGSGCTLSLGTHDLPPARPPRPPPGQQTARPAGRPLAPACSEGDPGRAGPGSCIPGQVPQGKLAAHCPQGHLEYCPPIDRDTGAQVTQGSPSLRQKLNAQDLCPSHYVGPLSSRPSSFQWQRRPQSPSHEGDRPRRAGLL